MEKLKKSNTKKIIALSLIGVLIAGIIATVTIGLINLKKSNKFDLDKMYIANFSSYTALGVGEKSSSSSSSSNVASIGIQTVFADSNKKDNKVIGVDHSGDAEEVKFCKNKNGKGEISQKDWRPIYFISFNKFSLVTFISSYYGPENFNQTFAIYNNTTEEHRKSFLIDNKTGKIYSLSIPYIEGGFVFGQFTFSDNPQYYYESDTSLYMPVVYSRFDNKLQKHLLDLYVFKLSIVDSNLEIKEMLNSDLLDFHPYIMVDRFDNLFLSYTNLHTEHPDVWSSRSVNSYDYMINANGLTNLNGMALYKGLNGYVYSSALGQPKQKFNASGELEDTIDTTSKVNLTSKTLLKRVDNVEYHYASSSAIKDYTIANPPSRNYIYKLTWIDANNYSLETIPVQLTITQDTQHVTTPDRIYFLDVNGLYYADVLTGQVETLSSQYIFQSISTDFLGNVVFTATNNQLKLVTGIIRNDGTIDISIKNYDFKIMYITPIN